MQNTGGLLNSIGSVLSKRSRNRRRQPNSYTHRGNRLGSARTIASVRQASGTVASVLSRATKGSMNRFSSRHRGQSDAFSLGSNFLPDNCKTRVQELSPSNKKWRTVSLSTEGINVLMIDDEYVELTDNYELYSIECVTDKICVKCLETDTIVEELTTIARQSIRNNRKVKRLYMIMLIMRDNTELSTMRYLAFESEEVKNYWVSTILIGLNEIAKMCFVVGDDKICDIHTRIPFSIGDNKEEEEKYVLRDNLYNLVKVDTNPESALWKRMSTTLGSYWMSSHYIGGNKKNIFLSESSFLAVYDSQKDTFKVVYPKIGLLEEEEYSLNCLFDTLIFNYGQQLSSMNHVMLVGQPSSEEITNALLVGTKNKREFIKWRNACLKRLRKFALTSASIAKEPLIFRSFDSTI